MGHDPGWLLCLGNWSNAVLLRRPEGLRGGLSNPVLLRRPDGLWGGEVCLLVGAGGAILSSALLSDGHFDDLIVGVCLFVCLFV